MALFKRGNVYWSYVWVDGIRHAKSTGASNRRTAERIDQQFKEELNLARMGVAEPKPEMTFSELAARFGLNPKTIRSYEEIGLLPQAHRSASGYRRYGERDIE